MVAATANGRSSSVARGFVYTPPSCAAAGATIMNMSMAVRMTTPMLFILRSFYACRSKTLVGVLVHRIVAPTRLKLPSITLARKILPVVRPHHQSNPCDEKERWKDKELGHLSSLGGRRLPPSPALVTEPSPRSLAECA